MTRSYPPLFIWLALTMMTSLMLYHTSDRVNALSRDLRVIDAQIDSERASMHVLKAEWVYLSNPARIEAAVKRHMTGLQPTAPARVASLQDIGSLLPLQRDGIELVRVATPVEPVRVAESAALRDSRPSPSMQLPHTKHERILASLNAGHINDHMILQHKTESTSVMASTDAIGALITSLSVGR